MSCLKIRCYTITIVLSALLIISDQAHALKKYDCHDEEFIVRYFPLEIYTYNAFTRDSFFGIDPIIIKSKSICLLFKISSTPSMILPTDNEISTPRILILSAYLRKELFITQNRSVISFDKTMKYVVKKEYVDKVVEEIINHPEIKKKWGKISK